MLLGGQLLVLDLALSIPGRLFEFCLFNRLLNFFLLESIVIFDSNLKLKVVVRQNLDMSRC